MSIEELKKSNEELKRQLNELSEKVDRLYLKLSKKQIERTSFSFFEDQSFQGNVTINKLFGTIPVESNLNSGTYFRVIVGTSLKLPEVEGYEGCSFLFYSLLQTSSVIIDGECLFTGNLDGSRTVEEKVEKLYFNATNALSLFPSFIVTCDSENWNIYSMNICSFVVSLS